MTMTLSQEELQDLLCPDGFVQVQIKGGIVWQRKDVTPEQLDMILTQEGDLLKESHKSRVSRLGHWVVKRRKAGLGNTMLRSLADREQLRTPWRANHFLRQQGVRVPEPLAFVEWSSLGMVTGTVHVFQYLQQCRDVETFLYDFIRQGADGDALTAFLLHLARAINTLCESGAYHGDLSGKNIYTSDGRRFYIIDFDAVELNVPYDDAKRLKNHVQLYDSFCDAMTDALLVPFIQAMTPESCDLRLWMPEVRRAQQERRAKVEEDWAKNGAPEKINPLRAFRR